MFWVCTSFYNASFVSAPVFYSASFWVCAKFLQCILLSLYQFLQCILLSLLHYCFYSSSFQSSALMFLLCILSVCGITVFTVHPFSLRHTVFTVHPFSLRHYCFYCASFWVCRNPDWNLQHHPELDKRINQTPHQVINNFNQHTHTVTTNL